MYPVCILIRERRVLIKQRLTIAQELPCKAPFTHIHIYSEEGKKKTSREADRNPNTAVRPGAKSVNYDRDHERGLPGPLSGANVYPRCSYMCEQIPHGLFNVLNLTLSPHSSVTRREGQGQVTLPCPVVSMANTNGVSGPLHGTSGILRPMSQRNLTRALQVKTQFLEQFKIGEISKSK